MELREIRTAFPEVLKASHQILHGLLQDLTVAFAEPRQLLLPSRKEGAQASIREFEVLVLFIAFLVPDQPFVVHKTGAAAELCKFAAGSPVGLKLELISFAKKHELILALV